MVASSPYFDFSGFEDPRKVKLEVDNFLNKIESDYDSVLNWLKCIFCFCFASICYHCDFLDWVLPEVHFL